MTTLLQVGRTDRQRAVGDLVAVSLAVRRVTDSIDQADPRCLLEPLVFAVNGARRAATDDSPILSAFLSAQERAQQWQDALAPADLRRFRVQAGSLGLRLQLDGVRLELAVRLRESLHPDRSVPELTQLNGVGLTAARLGYLLVRDAADGSPDSRLHTQVLACRQRADMVRTLNLLLVENLPDHRLDG